MDERDFEQPQRRIAGPATVLIAVSVIWGVVLLFALGFDVWLLASGFAAELPRPRTMSKETQILIRAVWGTVMLACDAVILMGALRMRELRSRSLSMTACVLTVIPCLGPCCLIGIPVGIWGIMVLNDPQVRTAFED